MRPVFEWNIGSRALSLGKRTLIMGVVNVTPDSFSDPGQFLDPEKAFAQALRLLDEGADIVDIGGESTRPGAKVSGSGPNQKGEPPKLVSETEELERVLPVIQRIKQERPKAVISVDTYKANVARAAVEAGAEIVNDVSAFRWDPKMAKTVADLKCGVVLMHMRGRPDEWRTQPPVPDIVVLVKRELRDWADAAILAGVKRERMVLDPGFGFGKTAAHNLELLARLEGLRRLGRPVCLGVSRKGILGRLLGRPTEQRLAGSLALACFALGRGAAQVLRVHDVAETRDAVAVYRALEGAAGPTAPRSEESSR
jgi:dihydropteroate synthase